jgi:hypothetical protein
MKIGVEPEALGRDDTEHGRWTTTEVPLKRGLPMTSIVDRVMKAPTGNDEASRAVRAHEMMHAKVSPAHDYQKWIEREIASHEALVAVEELRVNYLCSKAGFDMDALSDDGETADGERIAIAGDWRNAVMFAVATAGTGSAKKYLNGVRRHNRVWGKALLDIQKRAVKEMAKSYKTGTLASTEVHESGLCPIGYRHTEVIAEWIDRLAGLKPPDEDESEKKDESSDEADKDESGKSRGKDGKAHYTPKTEESPEKLGDFREKLKSSAPFESSRTGDIPRWGELIWGHIPLDAVSTGSMGKKRIATNIGRNPRRMARYMTDPHRRVFDRTIRGRGGIVVVDVSGSMSWTMEQVKTIVENAPGATVVAYSWAREGGANIYVLAKDGKMARDISEVRTAGNGVDFPAIQWAVENRRRNEKIIWVTDGGVTGVGDGFHDILAKQCVDYVRKHGIIVQETMEQAVDAFRAMSRGSHPISHMPSHLRYAVARAG